jgi:hypothetical protein
LVRAFSVTLDTPRILESHLAHPVYSTKYYRRVGEAKAE